MSDERDDAALIDALERGEDADGLGRVLAVTRSALPAEDPPAFLDARILAAARQAADARRASRWGWRRLLLSPVAGLAVAGSVAALALVAVGSPLIQRRAEPTLYTPELAPQGVFAPAPATVQDAPASAERAVAESRAAEPAPKAEPAPTKAVLEEDAQKTVGPRAARTVAGRSLQPADVALRDERQGWGVRDQGAAAGAPHAGSGRANYAEESAKPGEDPPISRDDDKTVARRGKVGLAADGDSAPVAAAPAPARRPASPAEAASDQEGGPVAPAPPPASRPVSGATPMREGPENEAKRERAAGSAASLESGSGAVGSVGTGGGGKGAAANAVDVGGADRLETKPDSPGPTEKKKDAAPAKVRSGLPSARNPELTRLLETEESLNAEGRRVEADTMLAQARRVAKGDPDLPLLELRLAERALARGDRSGAIVHARAARATQVLEIEARARQVETRARSAAAP